MSAVERWVACDGGALYTCSLGAGPPVAFVHGGPGGNHGYLLAHLGALAAGNRLLFVDQRGGGRTGRLGRSPRLADHAADLERVRIAYGAERLTLVAHSRGGLVALLYALEHPERIERIAIMSAIPPDPGFVDGFERALLARSERPAVAQRLAAFEQALDGAEDREEQLVRARLILAFFHDPFCWDGAMAMDHVPAEDGRWLDELDDLRARLREIAAPVLFLHGTDDPIEIATIRRVAAAIRSARLIELSRCGHYAMAERAEEVNAILSGFVAAGSWPE